MIITNIVNPKNPANWPEENLKASPVKYFYQMER